MTRMPFIPVCFLSENEEFARRCEEEGLTCRAESGPLHMFGDKLEAKSVAEKAEIATIPGTKISG